MPPCTRSHELAAPPLDATRECPLPAELLLEIVARSDAATLVRCAASCRPLRRDIVSPAFIRRVCREPDGIVPSSLLGFLNMNPTAIKGARLPPASFSLAHPATAAAASFTEKHLAPFMSRSAPVAGLYDYRPRESRNGLVLLNGWGPTSGMIDHLCVYDPMAKTNQCTFVPGPPDSKYSGMPYEYVLLTAADGIGSSFLLLAANFSGLTYGFIKVRTMQSNWCTWSPVTIASYSGDQRCSSNQRGRAAVLGTLIHWLMCDNNGRYLHIVTYDVFTAKAGSVQLPSEGVPDRFQRSNRHLTSTPNRGLRLLVADKLTISVWLLSGNAGWTRQAVIDTEETVRSVLRSSNTDMVEIMGFGVKSGVILLWPFTRNIDLKGLDRETIIALDVETKEMHRAKRSYMLHLLYEVDLKARLLAMKTF
ncbi:hypothetical protein EJB05_05555, partial [Eragrostis curvula]